MRVLSVDIGSCHYGICAVELADEQIPVLLDLRVVSLGDRGSVSTGGLVERLVRFYQTDYQLLQTGWAPDVVLIEQQMRAAPNNLALAFATMTFFLTRYGSPPCRVRWVRPTQKFTAYRKYWPSVEAPPDRQTYQQRKKASVLLANTILDLMGMPSLHLHPGCEDKQDDAADALLQAFCV